MEANIKNLFDRLNAQRIDEVFLKFVDESSHKIPAVNFRPALVEMGIVTPPEKMNELFKEAGIDDDAGMDKDEFIRVINMPSELEPWSSTLPLAKLLAACLEPMLARIASASDPVRKVANLTSKEIHEVTVAFSGAMSLLLEEQAKELKLSYSLLDKLAADGSDQSNTKFQIIPMNVGNSDNFHKGLANRVGEHRRPLLGQLRTRKIINC
jgi:hypothetical protein